MTVALVYIGDIRYAPFVSKYEKYLSNIGCETDVIYWNREERDQDEYPYYYAYRRHVDLNGSKFRKLFGFIGFRIFCIRQLKKKKYDRVILLTTLSGVFLYDYIKRRYSHRYILDIRDYSYENIGLFKKVEEGLIKNSFSTVISSVFFKKFLMEYDYTICHNYSGELGRQHCKEKKQTNISVGFVGSLRYFDYQRRIIDALANDDRFRLDYYGVGSEYGRYKEYMETKRIENLFLHGPFVQEDISRILDDVDILNNSYGYLEDKENPEIKYAISNKYYSGLQWKIPQLVESDSCKCALVESLNLGIGLDVGDGEFANKLYEFYMSFNRELLVNNANGELSRIEKEEKAFFAMLDVFTEEDK